jgi:YVTN family beta-propeller protein
VVRGSRAYAVCSGTAAIFVIDLNSSAVVDTIPCGAGSNPWSLAFISDTRAYVSRLNTNDVLALDLPAGTVAATIPVGRSPEGITVSGGRVFVANSGFNFSNFSYDPGTVA